MKKILIIVLVVVFLIVLFWLYNIFGVDISIRLNFNISIPVVDKEVYSFSDGGRDGDYYRVVKYNDYKIKRIKKLNWQEFLGYDSGKMKDLLSYLKEYKISKKYYPVVDDDTLCFMKTFDDKGDYLLMIYNPNIETIYIYEYHI